MTDRTDRMIARTIKAHTKPGRKTPAKWRRRGYAEGGDVSADDMIAQARELPLLRASAPPQFAVQNPYEAAAARVRRGVQPAGGRQEGALTDTLATAAPHLAGDMAAIPQRAIEGSAADLANFGDHSVPLKSIGPATDAAMAIMGGASAVPAEANTLRAGAKFPQGYFEKVPLETRLSRQGISHPGYRWEVYDKQTGAVLRKDIQTSSGANLARDRLDNKYGGYRYQTRAVPASQLTEDETKFLAQHNFSNSMAAGGSVGYADGGAPDSSVDKPAKSTVLSDDDFANFGAPAAAPAATPAAAPKVLSPTEFDSFGESAKVAVAPKELPDVGAPAISAGSGEFSRGTDWGNRTAESAGQTANKAIQSIPHSAYKFGKNTIEPILHPVDTAESLKNLGLGVLEKTGMVAGNEHEKYADAVGKFFADRYGSIENARKTLETDPIGMAGDLSMLLTGGGSAAARLPGVVGRTGEVAGTVGRAVNPLNALAPVGDAASAAARAVGLDRKAPVPTTRELRSASESNYRNMHGFGVEVHQHVMDGVATNIATELHADGYRDYLAPKTYRAIEELRNPAGANSATQDIEGVRRLLSKAAADPAERDAARRAIGHIDDTLANLHPNDVAVNPQFADRVAQEATQARANYAAFKRSDAIDELQRKASRQAASTGSGANIDNALRQKVRAMLDNPKKLRGFSDAERAQMEQIVRGTPVGNVARLLGKLAPSGIVSGALSAGAGFATHGPIGMVAVPLAGLAAKGLSDRMTGAKLNNLSRDVRMRSPVGSRMLGLAPRRFASVPGNTAVLSRAAGEVSPYGQESKTPYSP